MTHLSGELCHISDVMAVVVVNGSAEWLCQLYSGSVLVLVCERFDIIVLSIFITLTVRHEYNIFALFHGRRTLSG